MSTDKEQSFWQGESFWYRHFGFLSTEARAWFAVVLLIMILGGFYLGFWASCQQENPITVPYVTSENYFADKEAALAAMKDYLGDDGVMTLLLLGCDMRDGDNVGRSDTMMVAFVNLNEGAVNLLSIPRDTRVALAEGRGTTKINHAFAYGGVSLTRKTIENFLDIEIDRYVIVDFEGFAGLIDAVGGIEYDVEIPMHREVDNIDLEPGLQVLNGHDALAYVRFRGTPTADIGRIERQQKFIKAAIDQVMSTGTIFKLPQLAGTINEAIQTDFTLEEMISLANIYKDFASVEFNSDMLPGSGATISGISYWEYYPNQTAALVEQMKNFTLNEPEPEQTPQAGPEA